MIHGLYCQVSIMKSRESATNTDILVFGMIWDRYVAEREASTYTDIIEEFSLSDIFTTK